MIGKTIYDICPVYKTERFTLRMVQESDAKELLNCYSDPQAVRLMNADNCDTDFFFQTLDQMSDYLQGWLGAYRNSSFVRFSIVDNTSEQVIGTIEMFDKNTRLGILRLDICTSWEKQNCLSEILKVCVENFYEAFQVKQIAIKAIAEATERIAALKDCGFTFSESPLNGSYGNYFIR